jgi:uncharacterized protein (DUF924 family)
MQDQELGLKIIAQIKKKYPTSFCNVIANLELIHNNHIDRIRMFGRIPDRNQYLNRKSTQ